ncbi:hypothetical protein C8Q72DRAFT_245018 [Fomitopsis betulina]|nr:hypothetical protein C8Q72DRAFT_245018 [Fomitopsis betulina]
MLSQALSSFPNIKQRRLPTLQYPQLSRNVSHSSGLERSSVTGQETIARLNEDCVSWSNTLDAAALHDSGKKAMRADDCGSLPLKSRLKTSSRAARDLIKSKHLLDGHSDYHPRSVEPAVSGLRDQVESLVHELAAANAIKADTEGQVSELEDLLDLAITGITQLQARNEELDCICTDHERLLNDYDERTRDSETMLHSAVTQVEQLTFENEKLVDQKAALYNALSESLATSGRTQRALEAQVRQLKASLAARDAEVSSVSKELLDACKTADDRVEAINSMWEKKVEAVVNQKAQLHLETSEHRHKVAYLEKQKATAEEALTTCKADLRIITSKLRTTQGDLKLANVKAEVAQKREQASERHITFMESLMPVESKAAKRLTDLTDKLEMSMAKSRHARASGLHDVTNCRDTVLKDLYEDTPAPIRPIGKGPLAMKGHVSSVGTKSALSLQDKRLGTTAVRPASPCVPEPDWLNDSSVSFIKMHASNLDISEGELFFGPLATDFAPKRTTAEARATARRFKAAALHKTSQVTARRRL